LETFIVDSLDEEEDPIVSRLRLFILVRRYKERARFYYFWGDSKPKREKRRETKIHALARKRTTFII
jgi:hypothetical protein